MRRHDAHLLLPLVLVDDHVDGVAGGYRRHLRLQGGSDGKEGLKCLLVSRRGKLLDYLDKVHGLVHVHVGHVVGGVGGVLRHQAVLRLVRRLDQG